MFAALPIVNKKTDSMLVCYDPHTFVPVFNIKKAKNDHSYYLAYSVLGPVCGRLQKRFRLPVRHYGRCCYARGRHLWHASTRWWCHRGGRCTADDVVASRTGYYGIRQTQPAARPTGPPMRHPGGSTAGWLGTCFGTGRCQFYADADTSCRTFSHVEARRSACWGHGSGHQPAARPAGPPMWYSGRFAAECWKLRRSC